MKNSFIYSAALDDFLSTIKFVGTHNYMVDYNKRAGRIRGKILAFDGSPQGQYSGMSVDRAHDELIKDQGGSNCCVITGVDIDHPSCNSISGSMRMKFQTT